MPRAVELTCACPGLPHPHHCREGSKQLLDVRSYMLDVAQSTYGESLECRRLVSVQSPGIRLLRPSHTALHNATAFLRAGMAFHLAFLDTNIGLPNRVSTPRF